MLFCFFAAAQRPEIKTRSINTYPTYTPKVSDPFTAMSEKKGLYFNYVSSKWNAYGLKDFTNTASISSTGIETVNGITTDYKNCFYRNPVTRDLEIWDYSTSVFKPLGFKGNENNIYNSDGTLTGNRLINANGKRLDIYNMSGLTVQTSGATTINAATGMQLNTAAMQFNISTSFRLFGNGVTLGQDATGKFLKCINTTGSVIWDIAPTFANTDLAFTTNRTHNANNFDLSITNLKNVSLSGNNSVGNSFTISNFNKTGINTPQVEMSLIPLTASPTHVLAYNPTTKLVGYATTPTGGTSVPHIYTVGTTAPVAPNIGDVWNDTSPASATKPSILRKEWNGSAWYSTNATSQSSISYNSVTGDFSLAVNGQQSTNQIVLPVVKQGETSALIVQLNILGNSLSANDIRANYQQVGKVVNVTLYFTFANNASGKGFLGISNFAAAGLPPLGTFVNGTTVVEFDNPATLTSANSACGIIQTVTSTNSVSGTLGNLNYSTSSGNRFVANFQYKTP